MHLPSTRTLRAFVVAAQFGSLAASSVRLAMSVPALSRRLSDLERELGVRLLDRGPRGVALTAAGAAYLAHATAVLDRLQAAAAELRPDGAVVRLTTIPALATRWLLPRLPDFAERHPGIEVEVRTSVAFERVETGGFDLAVRLALDGEMGVEPLLPVHLMPVWSAAHPRAIEDPGDVLRHPLLGPDHRPEFWREWLMAAGFEEGAVRVREIDALLLYEQALTGAGVAIGVAPLIDGLLREGRLTGLPRHEIRSDRSFFLIERAEPRTRAARLFARWLRERARSAVREAKRSPCP